MFLHAVVDAIDVDEDHVERARHACIDFADRVTVRRGDAFDIDAPSGTYDLVVCRHVLQSIPHPDRVIRELARITRPGGRLHIVAEDYGMIHFHPCRPETDEFFSRGPVVFGKALGTDLRIGRRIYSILRDLDLTDIRLDYLVLDTLRVPRTTLAGIFEAWREGYTDAIARNSDLATAQILESWADMIECTRNPDGYAVWLLPVAGATPGPLVA